MNLPANPFTQAIARGDKQIGLWVTLSSPYAAEVTAPSGFDWVVVDMEHAPNDYLTVLGQLQAYAGTGTTALVRPEWNNPVIVKRLLDLGAQGLVFPMVQTADEARAAVAATRYPPRGVRGVSGSTRGNKFGRVKDYFQRIEDETTVILQIETEAALERAEEIAAVEGVSGIFFGPADIAADLGYLGHAMHDEVWNRIRPVAARLIKAGIPVGTLVQDRTFAAELLNNGFTFVACGIDTALLAKAADNLLADVKAQLK